MVILLDMKRLFDGISIKFQIKKPFNSIWVHVT